MRVLLKKKSVSAITSSETGSSAARPQVSTRKRVDSLKRRVTSSYGKHPFFFSALFAGQRVTVPWEVFLLRAWRAAL